MSKTTKKVIIGAAMAALLPAAAAVASPLVNLRLVLNGTQAGIGNDGDSVANVTSVGQTINVRLETALAAVGTTNATMSATITSKTDYDGSNAATSDGVNSLRFDVRNGAGTGIVGDFDSVFALSSEATAGAGQTGGTLVSKGTSTASSTDPNEIQGTKAVGATSTPFQNSANAFRTFATGVIKVTSLGDGGSGSMNPVLSFSNLNAPAALFINGHQPVGPSWANQNTGADKPVAYQGLSLQSAPEPASLGLLGMAAVGLIRRRRQA